jgi:hypothetical protein
VVVYLGNRADVISRLQMAVIVQRQVNPRAAGVLFSVHPLDVDAGVLIEAACRPQVITDGGSATRFRVKGNEVVREGGDDAVLSRHEVLELGHLGLSVQGLCGHPVDLEWALEGDRLLVLQSRPAAIVTGRRRNGPPPPETDGLTILPNEDDRVLAGLFDFGDCHPVRRRFGEKKTPVRVLCRAEGIRLPAWIWVRVTNENGLAELERRLPSLFPSGIVLVTFNRLMRAEPVTCGDLPTALRRMGIGCDRPATLLLREMIPADFSAISGMLPGDRVLIESVQGQLSGIREGLFDQSSYICGRDGTVIENVHRPQAQVSIFDPRTRRFRTVPNPLDAEMPDRALAVIATHTVALSGLLGEVRAEWSVWQGREYFFDLTRESKALAAVGASCAVISPGTAAGRIVKVDDDSEFKTFATGNAIGVYDIPDEGDLPAHITGWLRDHLGDRSRPTVIVARRPYLAFGLLLRVAQGFVFEEGGLLSHLAIQLREGGKPAIICPGACSAFAEGDFIMFSAGPERVDSLSLSRCAKPGGGSS